MQKHHRDMVNTRILYKWEDDLYRNKNFRSITKKTDLRSIRRLAKRIWKVVGNGRPMPEVRFGKGTYHGGSYYSWCEFQKQGTVIELAPLQRDKITLIHEMVHAIGKKFDYHSPAFVNMELYLLMEFTNVPKHIILSEAMKLCEIKN